MTFTCLRLAGWYKQVSHTSAGTPGINACLHQLALQNVTEHGSDCWADINLRAVCHDHDSNVLLRLGQLHPSAIIKSAER